MELRNRTILALSLVAFVPTISILFTLNFNDDELTSQIFFLTCKLWLLFAPAFWYLRIEGNEISRSPADKQGLVMGAITGILMSAIILIMWLIFGDTIDSESMLAELETTGLTDIRIYIAGMLYWIFLNSLLEEYVFRWFVTTKGIELFGSEFAGITLSAMLFTLHHAIALHYFGFIWWQTVLASFGLLSAAAIWSWLYIRYNSIWVCWLSHAICDIAVFGIGYLLIFG
ncbi:MAG: type II CAAX endopeptidase family protein [Candidatus Thermoplasmatota archaeon]|nr:type II CAAX endopeptidase family protein [Candidatus Thermoplasmatota archaeon]